MDPRASEILAFLGNAVRKNILEICLQPTELFPFFLGAFHKTTGFMSSNSCLTELLVLSDMCPFCHFSFPTPSLLTLSSFTSRSLHSLPPTCQPPTCYCYWSTTYLLLTGALSHPHYFGFDFYEVYRNCGKGFFKTLNWVALISASKTPCLQYTSVCFCYMYSNPSKS